MVAQNVMLSGERSIPSSSAGRSVSDLLAQWGEPNFRFRQIAEWKYQKLAAGFDEMRNLPLGLRERLDREAPFAAVHPIDEIQSADGCTTKTLHGLADGQLIESVLMRHNGPHERGQRNTVCVSSQAGCKMRCSFCATGHGGWRRNLTPDEIADQVLHFARVLKAEDQRVTNVVFMGMGEPLDNYKSVVEAIHLLNSPEAFGLGARNITISTCGLVPEIRRLAAEPVQVNLAVSLAATTDERRDELIPANRRWPIHELLSASDEYVRRTHRRVTFEYVLIAGVNGGPDDARRIASLLKGRLAHVNLIPLNPVDGDGYQRPSEQAVRAFEDVLRQAHIPISVRYSKGTDIVAGCGQLRARAVTPAA